MAKEKTREFIKNNKLLTIGNYEFHEVMPGGGTNITAIYKNKKNELAVAKFFFIGPNSIDKKRFDNEIANHKLGRALTEVLPRIIKEFSTQDGHIRGYLMEHIKGELVSDILSKEHTLSRIEIAGLFYRILWSYHHTLLYVTHGDMHPGNIILESTMDDWLNRRPESPEARILDLGSSISPINFAYDETFDKAMWTEVRRRYGGSFYSLAPEFFRPDFGKLMQEPGLFDCWSLGILLYKTVTGKLIEIADSLGEYVDLIYSKKLQRKIDAQIDSNCSDEHLNFLIKSMIRVDTSKRIRLTIATAYTCQLYNESPELMDKTGRELYEYTYRRGCDPEYGLPPHERSNSPY